MARHLRGGDQRTRRLRRAPPGGGPVRRDRGAPRPDRRRRVSRPALLRHPDEPGRDGPPDRFPRPHRQGGGVLPLRCGRDPDRRGQHAGEPRRPGGADARRRRLGDRGRLGPRRGHGGDPLGDAPLRQGRGGGSGPRVAPAERLHPDGDRHQDGRARRLRPDDPRGVRRHGPAQDRHVRGLGGAVPGLYRRRLARHPLGDRRGADPVRRHRGAEAAASCPGSPAATSCRPRCSPSRTPARTSPACAPRR